MATRPTGCESVSAVMALHYAGFSTSVNTFIDQYLPKTPFGQPFDPNVTFGGNPRGNGYGCYAPVIKGALNQVLANENYNAVEHRGVTLAALCSQYIDNNIPVIIWATMGMRTPYVSETWQYQGRTINWIAPEHCLLLVGYDENHYFFNDPLMSIPCVGYSKEAVELAYNGLGKQAVVIVKSANPEPPVEPSDPEPPANPVFRYGSVKRPNTDIYYPIHYFEGEIITTPKELENMEGLPNPLRVQYTEIDWLKFISGIEISDIAMNLNPYAGFALGVLIGAAVSAQESMTSTYIDVYFYIHPSTGEREAELYFGTSEYDNLFSSYTHYNSSISLKHLHSTWHGNTLFGQILMQSTIDDLAKDLYGKYTNTVPNESYKYDLEYTLDGIRFTNNHVAKIFLGAGGDMYESCIAYKGEKIEIVVKTILGIEVDRINILPLLNRVTKFPKEVSDKFDIEIIK